MSFGLVRRYVSLFRPVILSTVRTITEHPAASTRRSSFSHGPQAPGAYSWNQTGRPSALLTSSIGTEVDEDRICNVPRCLAAAATANSPSRQYPLSPPVGHRKMGLS